MDPQKNRDRRKLFTCFKPVTVDDYVHRYNAALPNSSEYECHQKTKNHQSFSTGLKSVLVKYFLVKKLQRKKPRQKSCRSSSDLSSKSEKLVNAVKKNLSYNEFPDSGDFFTTNTNSSATVSTRSSISWNSDRIKGPVSFDSREIINTTSKEEQVLKWDDRKLTCKPTTIAMFVFVVCLFALVFGGKPFAILICTSMCLFFAPSRRSQRVDSLVNEVIDSDEYKKRVIIEGLLERKNRPRVLYS